MNNQLPLDLFENSDDASDLYKIVTWKDGKVYISQSGEFLVRRDEAQMVMDACRKYLDHITDDVIEDFNERLLDHRHAERDLENKRFSKKSREPKLTYIYVMFNNRNGYYKIGQSKYPHSREVTLQAQEPEIDMIYHREGTTALEKALHERYSEKRIRGEWFSLTPEDVEDLKTFCEAFMQ